MEIEIEIYETAKGKSPFEILFDISSRDSRTTVDRKFVINIVIGNG